MAPGIHQFILDKLLAVTPLEAVFCVLCFVVP